jgi:heat shock protein HtpX
VYLVPTRELQAFAVKSGGQSAIGITPSLLDELSPEELEGVLAHELSHLANGDTRVMATAAAMRGLTKSLASLAWLLLLFSILVPGALSVSLGAILLLSAAPMLSTLAELGLSRTREFHADLAAVALTGRPESLARALFKLEQHQTGLLRRLVGRGAALELPEGLRTHPATSERIRRLMALSQGLRNTRWSVTTV